jgi:16S rRNA processing protein RimM
VKTVPVGKITKPHGLRGEVRVELHWKGSDSLLEVEWAWLTRPDAPDERRRIQSARRANQAILVKFENSDDRDAAEALRGASVCLDRAALPEPEAGEYYLVDLLGARVVGPGGEVGRIVRIHTHPSVDSVTIEMPDGRLAEQPLAEAWVDEVDLEANVVTLSSLDGLIV